MMLELLLFPFFQRALITGLILGVLMAVLGVFVVLRRMSFFADAIGHSALTGIALGLLLKTDPFFAALVFALLVAAGIALLRHYSHLHLDTLLGVFFPAAVALGVIIVQLTPGFQTDLVSFLFGDILTVSNVDIVTSIIIAIVVGVILVTSGKRLLLITFNEALARSQGIAVPRYELLFLLMLAAVIAISIKLVGIILITAMIVIPAATAQNLTRSMSSMIGVSVAVSLIAVLVGMLSSALLSLPSGPTVVLVGATLFAASFLVARLRSA